MGATRLGGFPMDILCNCYEYPPLGGGGGVVADGLARAFAATGNSVDLVTMAFRGLPRQENLPGFRVFRVPAWRRQLHYCSLPEAATYVLPAWKRLTSLARHHEYRVVHSHFILPDGALACALSRKTGLPFVITAHGSDVPSYNPDRLKLAHQLLSPLWNRVVRSAARVICPSQRLASLLLESCPEARVTVIPNGLEPATFRADRPKQPRILVATRLLPRKGIRFLLEAAQRTQLTREIHVLGDGPERESLVHLAQDLPHPPVFYGWVANRSSEYLEAFETSDIFVLPSESENFPMVLLEAMAAGMAIVTTQGTGCDEVVGTDAVLIPPRDPQALGQALARLESDPAMVQALGQAARRRFVERFSFAAVAQQYLAVFEQVVGSSGSVEAPAARA